MVKSKRLRKILDLLENRFSVFLLDRQMNTWSEFFKSLPFFSSLRLSLTFTIPPIVNTKNNLLLKKSNHVLLIPPIKFIQCNWILLRGVSCKPDLWILVAFYSATVSLKVLFLLLVVSSYSHIWLSKHTTGCSGPGSQKTPNLMNWRRAGFGLGWASPVKSFLICISLTYAFPCVLETKADVFRLGDPIKSTNAQLEHPGGTTHWFTSLSSDQCSPLHTSCHSIPIRAPL